MRDRATFPSPKLPRRKVQPRHCPPAVRGMSGVTMPTPDTYVRERNHVPMQSPSPHPMRGRATFPSPYSAKRRVQPRHCPPSARGMSGVTMPTPNTYVKERNHMPMQSPRPQSKRAGARPQSKRAGDNVTMPTTPCPYVKERNHVPMRSPCPQSKRGRTNVPMPTPNTYVRERNHVPMATPCPIVNINIVHALSTCEYYKVMDFYEELWLL